MPNLKAGLRFYPTTWGETDARMHDLLSGMVVPFAPHQRLDSSARPCLRRTRMRQQRLTGFKSYHWSCIAPIKAELIEEGCTISWLQTADERQIAPTIAPFAPNL